MKPASWSQVLFVVMTVFLAQATGHSQQVRQRSAIRHESVSQTQPRWYSLVVPLSSRVTPEMVRNAVAAGTTLPMWDYTVTSPIDGNSYTGSMVGRSPFFHGKRTTGIQVFIIPVIVDMPDGGVFDPTAPDPTCSPAGTAVTLTQQSPIIQPAPFSMGPTAVGTAQYVDAFQRGNFWTNFPDTGSYHTVLSPVTTLSAITVTVPSGSGVTCNASLFGGCGYIGEMDNTSFDSDLQNTIIPALASQGVGPNTLPIFLFYNVWQTQGPPDLTCSTVGGFSYHGAYGSPPQTYSVVNYDTSGVFAGGNVSIMSHEVAEWMDDPLGTNPTPAWGNVGQVQGCQNNLEVGDPLTGTLFPSVTMSNGFTYDLQELAFFSWFFRQSPSIAVNGWYSDYDTFTSGQSTVCQ